MHLKLFKSSLEIGLGFSVLLGAVSLCPTSKLWTSRGIQEGQRSHRFLSCRAVPKPVNISPKFFLHYSMVPLYDLTWFENEKWYTVSISLGSSLFRKLSHVINVLSHSMCKWTSEIAKEVFMIMKDKQGYFTPLSCIQLEHCVTEHNLIHIFSSNSRT